MTPPAIVTNLSAILQIATEKADENDRFKYFLSHQNSSDIDKHVEQLNEWITSQIDCTACGNCCRSLMITVSEPEIENLASHLQKTVKATKDEYVEQSSQSNYHILNTIPCHFLHENKCTIYEQRFSDCREFPHLHQPNFTARLFSIMMHYEMCPIIFNVIEHLKQQTLFYKTH